MLSKRIIACLDVRDGQVVKGMNFEGLRSAGDPAELARRYNAEGIDELVILDITATLEARRALADTIRAVARELFIPLAVGGGIRTEDGRGGGDRRGRRQSEPEHRGAVEPVAHHHARRPLRQPGGGRRHRRQARERRRASPSTRAAARPRPTATPSSGRARPKSRGAGEILLTSIDRDGTKAGFDCPMTAAVSAAVSIPVIASGGAGGLDHFVDVFTAGRADAALAASIFHYAETSVALAQTALARKAFPCVLAMKRRRHEEESC